MKYFCKKGGYKFLKKFFFVFIHFIHTYNLNGKINLMRLIVKYESLVVTPLIFPFFSVIPLYISREIYTYRESAYINF